MASQKISALIVYVPTLIFAVVYAYRKEKDVFMGRHIWPYMLMGGCAWMLIHVLLFD